MVLNSKHYLIVGDCTEVNEIKNLPLIDLLITSPPYFNAPFDYKDLYDTYEGFLTLMEKFGKIYFDRLSPNGIFAINIDDMLVKGIKYPIIADITKILTNIGLKLKGQIIWKKPDGYIRISRRSGVFLQHPYPMYYYPDNLIESILIFQKLGKIGWIKRKKMTQTNDIWPMTNVLPIKGRLEENIAAFPEQLPKNLITLFTQKQDWVCDPFLGSGTTMKVAKNLNRNSIGIEILPDLIPIIENKIDHEYTLVMAEKNNIARKRERKKRISSLHYTLKSDSFDSNNTEYDLIVLDLRKTQKINLNEKFTELLRKLRYGRICIVLYNSIEDNINQIPLYLINDTIMTQGIKFRDKITVWYENDEIWTIETNKGDLITFQHDYYEVFIYQKGKFEYKSKSKRVKERSRIDKKQFLSEKWFLSLWDFRGYSKTTCNEVVISRIIDLFSYNDERVAMNTKFNIKSNRNIIIDYVNI